MMRAILLHFGAEVGQHLQANFAWLVLITPIIPLKGEDKFCQLAQS